MLQDINVYDIQRNSLDTPFNSVSVHPSCGHIEYKVVMKEKHLNAAVKGGFEIHIKLQMNFYTY